MNVSKYMLVKSLYTARVIRALRAVTIIVLSLLFSACSQKEIQIKTIEEPRIELKLADPKPLKLETVSFYIITEQNKDQIFNELSIKQKDKVLIGLTDDDYIKMSKNLILIQNYLSEQKFIINEYKKYYEHK